LSRNQSNRTWTGRDVVRRGAANCDECLGKLPWCELYTYSHVCKLGFKKIASLWPLVADNIPKCLLQMHVRCSTYFKSKMKWNSWRKTQWRFVSVCEEPTWCGRRWSMPVGVVSWPPSLCCWMPGKNLSLDNNNWSFVRSANKSIHLLLLQPLGNTELFSRPQFAFAGPRALYVLDTKNSN